MRAHIRQRFTQEIAWLRKEHVRAAALYALDTDQPPHRVQQYADLAGESWDRRHPHLASYLQPAPAICDCGLVEHPTADGPEWWACHGCPGCREAS